MSPKSPSTHATSHPEAGAHTIVYVSNADSQDISVLALDEENGQLALLDTVPVGGRVMPLTISPDRLWLFAGLRSEPYTVRVFAIDPGSGRLQPASMAPLADNMCYLSTDRTGRFLFAASYSGSRISVNAIGPDGEVSPAPLAVIPTGENAHAVATDPSNRFLFVPNLGDDEIRQFRFDATTGAITPNEPPLIRARPGAGPRHFVFHPHRQFVYCLNQEDGTVDTFRLEAPGTLSPLASISALPGDFTGKVWAADIHLTPDGGFLYTSERTSSTLTAFRVDGEAGALTLLGHYPTETQPRGFTITPSGRYLLAAGEASGGLRVHVIDRNSGALRDVSRLDIGQGPNWVETITV